MTVQKNWKLNRFTRARLEETFRRRQERAEKVLGADLNARLTEMAERLLRAAYGPAQADMLTLMKYELASQVEGVNFHVFDPLEKNYAKWRDTIGVTVDMAGFMLPGANYPYTDMYLGGPAGDKRHGSIDWQLARECLDIRYNYRDRQATERKEFAVAIRATSSWCKLVSRFPWIDDEFPPQYVPQEIAA